jgi:hypothetical protein
MPKDLRDNQARIGKTTVTYGWQKVTQEALIPGMPWTPGAFEVHKKIAAAGPGGYRPTAKEGLKTMWAGISSQGSLSGGYHNLFFKDVVFQAEGQDPVGAIINQMQDMHYVKIRCGIREGMEIEDWKEDEGTTGGGLEQFKRKATRDDIVRVDYYTYVYEPSKDQRSFDALLSKAVFQVVGFAGGAVHAGVAAPHSESLPANLEQFGKEWLPHFLTEIPELREKIGKLKELVEGMLKEGQADLLKAMKSKKAVLVLTSRKSHVMTPIATHKHMHPLPFLAGDVINAVKEIASCG